MSDSERKTFFTPTTQGGYIEDQETGLHHLQAAGYNSPRALTGAAERINLQQAAKVTQQKRSMQWQHAAFDYFDRVGELQSVGLLVAHLVSRAMIYAAVVKDPSAVPVDAEGLIENPDPERNPELDAACEIAIEALAELFADGQSGILDRIAMNLFVVGECYLANVNKVWTVASIDELRIGNPTRLRRTQSPSGNDANGIILPNNTFVTRLWRPHPRWYNDPFSSVLGVLDQLEMVVLFDQTMRHLARQRMNAGIITIDNNITTADNKSMYEAVTEFTQQAIEDESSGATVTPLLLLKPPSAANANGGSFIEWTEVGRKIDDQLLKASQFAIDRVITGLDVPKDSVSSMQGVRYSNAIVSSDALLRTHIEPLIILVCDLITTAYLKPIFRKNKISAKVANQVVAWYNPANIVTRPDKSTAANEGMDRHVISAKAWRSARGFTELDAPSGAEILTRIAVERARLTLPPQDTDDILRSIDPKVFPKKIAFDQNGVPVKTDTTLKPTTETPSNDVNAPKPSSSGGPVPQGGTMPPR